MSAVNKHESYRGKGTFYFKKKGDDAVGLIPVGNASQGDIAFAESKVEQKDFEEAGGAVIDSISSVDNVTLTLQVLNLNTSNIARAIGGSSAELAIATIVEATSFTSKGSFIPFDKIPDKSQTITVTNADASTTFVDGADYEMRNSGLVILSDALAGTSGVVNYTSVDFDKIQALTEIGGEYELVYDGYNEARKTVFKMKAHRVKIGLTQALQLISDDYAGLPLTVDLLKDPSVSGTGLSKYFYVDKQKAA